MANCTLIRSSECRAYQTRQTDSIGCQANCNGEPFRAVMRSAKPEKVVDADSFWQPRCSYEIGLSSLNVITRSIWLVKRKRSDQRERRPFCPADRSTRQLLTPCCATHLRALVVWRYGWGCKIGAVSTVLSFEFESLYYFLKK